MNGREPGGAATPVETGFRPEVGARLTDGGRWVEVFARAHLPTRHGAFEMWVCRCDTPGKEHVVLVRGEVAGRRRVMTRLHSECLTGDALGSLRCDCREQLEMSMAALGEAPEGILLYLRQEGRGIGLGQKIRAYALQEQGLDTFEANRCLGFEDDLRDWQVAAMLLRLLNVGSVVLLTNNPDKLAGLGAHGVQVAGRQALVVAANPHNRDYLRAKAARGGHLFEPRPYAEEHLTAIAKRSRGIILTDDYAPVENLLAPVAETRGKDKED